ncbi:serine protease, partial [Allorhizocola rhizosphaerae]|uniref:serine protease n=1 Tax=Allorhizocola rhizosphaerae TaxID=1872709 RepID=UPI001478700F
MEQPPAAGVTPGWSGWQELLAHATVALETPHGMGTGFSVAPGVIVTCAHVIAPDSGALPETVVGEVVISGQKLTLTCAPEDYFRDEHGLDLAFLRWPGLLPPVLVKPTFAIGDPMWTFGHPESRFRGGQSAMLRYEGPGRLHGPDGIEVHRVFGAPVYPGASGSPVVNLATGAVCGMLCLAGSSGSAHFLSAREILERCPEARILAGGGHLMHESWLEDLTDEQIRRGGWAFPGPTLRDYLRFAVKAADSHPYPGVVPGFSPPPLSEVYVQPLAWQGDEPEAGQPGLREPVPAKAIIDEERDAILVGDAGSGKSSFMRVEVKAMIDRYLRGADNRVPVRVMAADLVGAQPLAELVAASVNGELHAVGFGRTLSGEFFARPPAPGARWLVLVDSLDEVMRADQRRAVLDKLLAPGEDRPFDLVIATRPLTEPHPAIGRYALLPFTIEQVRQFASGWFGHLGLPNPAAMAERFTAALRAQGVAELAQSPLVATMLCQLFAADSEAALPTGRTKVYERFVELLNGRRFSGTPSGIRQQVLGVLAPYGRDAEDVGEALLADSQELVQRLAFARQKGAAEGVVALLAEWTAPLRPGDVPPDTWRELLTGLVRRGGQLAQRHGEFMFLHQTIEEYLAAQYVAADPYRTRDELGEVFNAASWKTGRVTVGRQSYARFLVAACGQRPEVAGALRRIARRGGLDGARFVAALAADGIRIEAQLARTTLASLRRHAMRSRSDDEMRLAVTAAAQLDARTGQALLIRQIRKRRNGLAYRRWALLALAEAAA